MRSAGVVFGWGSPVTSHLPALTCGSSEWGLGAAVRQEWMAEVEDRRTAKRCASAEGPPLPLPRPSWEWRPDHLPSPSPQEEEPIVAV